MAKGVLSVLFMILATRIQGLDGEKFTVSAVANCKTMIKYPSYYKLDATTTTKYMCRVLSQPANQSSQTYTVSAELLNQAGWQGINSGHPGVLFNAVDENNFDFVYFRPHSSGHCYQTGYMSNGSTTFVESKACPKGPPRGGVWFPVSIKVHGKDVQVYLNGDLVTSVKSHFTPQARGGAFTFHGYKNVVLFRKFEIVPQPSYVSKKCARVVEYPDYVKLDADHGKWPQDGFCQMAYLKDGGQSADYQLSVDLFNVMGWKGVNSGHLGVFFNAEDQDNYDFVYFRPHSTGGCFQTGYVYNGQLKWDGAISSSCPNGPPKGGEWFHVKLTVSTATPSSEVKVYLNGTLVGSWNPHHSIKNRGGVLVANGYKNVVHFRKFQIVPQPSYVSKKCARTVEYPNYVKLDADHGKWPQDGFCKVAYLEDGGQSTDYQLSVDLFNVMGWKGVNSGHPGVFFNAKDQDNYDFVYFRPHSTGGCFQTGYVYNGQLKWDGSISSSCPNGPPKGGEWFHVKLTVSTATPSSEVKVYLNGTLVRSWNPHHPIKNRGGVLVANGYKNVVHFRKFQIVPQPSYISKKCAKTVQYPNYFELDANHGKWPQDGFCQMAYLKDGGQSTDYQLSVDLFNVMGWKGVNSGHPGVFFNAEDQDNYDFVYFRPHSTGGCFQTGYVYNGQLKWDGSISSSCPNGPPKGGEWFHVKLTVSTSTPSSEVKVYLNGTLVRSWNPHHPIKNRGGVLVANGYKNVVHFRKFQIVPQPSYVSKKCAKTVQYSDYFELDANHGKWPQDGFCQMAYLQDCGQSTDYQLSVDLFNVMGWKGVNSGHPGVFFNAEDQDNYDFVYFRPHSTGGCFQTGYVYNGQLKWDGSISSSCPNGPPKGGEWFHVKLTVSTSTPSSEVKVYLNGTLVRSWNPHHPIKNRGGVLVANGYKNVVHFKNFHIQ